jgi:hypothetical protein
MQYHYHDWLGKPNLCPQLLLSEAEVALESGALRAVDRFVDETLAMTRNHLHIVCGPMLERSIYRSWKRNV